jgi:hypothetical protein
MVTLPDGTKLGSSRCTARLIYNGPDKAVVLTAAHCIGTLGGSFTPALGDGVNFDSQVVDDSVTPYRLTVIQPQRVVNVDQVIINPLGSADFIPGLTPMGNSESYTANDMALLVIDDPVKLSQLNSLWNLPHGQLVKLLPENYLSSLSAAKFRNLPLLDAGDGRDWIDYDNPSGPTNAGLVGNKGFRTVVNLTPTSLSTERIVTKQNQQQDLEGICLGDSGSSAFMVDSKTGEITIVAMPTAVHGGVLKCQATTGWNRLDRPNARSFIGCAFVFGDASVVQNCVDLAVRP